MFTREIFSYHRDGYYPFDKKCVVQGGLYALPFAMAAYPLSYVVSNVVKIPPDAMKIFEKDCVLHNYLKEQVHDGIKSSRVLTNLTFRYLILGAIIEEVAFRGVLQQTVLGRSKQKDEPISTKVGRVVCAAIPFALLHLKSSYIGVQGGNKMNAAVLFSTFKAGLLFGGLVELTGNLWAATFAHIFENIGISAHSIHQIRREFARPKL